jgi:amidase
MTRSRLMGYIPRPTRDRLRSLASLEYMALTDAEASAIETLADGVLGMLDRLDELPQPQAALKYPTRDRGYRPSPAEDPYNAFIWRCHVQGAPAGKLAGKRIGLKDNIRLAGVPMTNGSYLLADFVPSVDAVVAERLLDAGAVIVGKLNMDDFALAGTSETSAFGCIRNPANPEFSAGGSSGGSGAAVASGDVDIALAVDQGGSARIPASWCGVVGLKPTHGLVPSFGITYLDHTLDFVSPIARSVAEVALTLEVIAGDDPRDPQWVRGPIPAQPYSTLLDGGVRGIRIGVLREGILEDITEPDVLTAFRAAVATFDRLGASVTELSLPLWSHGQAIWNGFALHSISAMIESGQEGFGRLGLCDVGWQQAFGDARRAHADRLPLYMKTLLVLGNYLRRDLGSVYFGKATNLRWQMRREFDALFDGVDVILTPTMPRKAFRLLQHSPRPEELAERAAGMCQNTYPTNVTGNPSLTVPCGRGENDLPIGLQIIGRNFADATVLRVGHAFETNTDGAW